MTGATPCNGTGKLRPFEIYYSLDEETVREFRDFLAASDGFGSADAAQRDVLVSVSHIHYQIVLNDLVIEPLQPVLDTRSSPSSARI